MTIRRAPGRGPGPDLRLRSVLLLALFSLAVPGGLRPAAGQSLLSSAGLGSPVEPLDARGRGLGGSGVGLFGAGVGFRDPSGAAGLLLPTVTATLQATRGRGEGDLAGSSHDSSRFPHIGIGYPVGERIVFLFEYGGYLDQRWTLERRLQVPVGGVPVDVVDSFLSEGGISSLLLGAGYRISDRVAVGVTGGLHTGSIRRTFIREFDRSQADVEPFVTSARWSTAAPVVVAGVTVDPASILRLSGSLTWSGDLRAEPEEGEGALEQDFPLPLEFRGGLSVALTPVLSASAGGSWADWTPTGGSLNEGSGVKALALGGGLEWSAGSLFGRRAPVRVGWRRADFPFRVEGQKVVESALGVGSGLVLSEFEGTPLAGVDLSVERGSRAAGGASEDFWRTTLTLRISGR